MSICYKRIFEAHDIQDNLLPIHLVIFLYALIYDFLVNILLVPNQIFSNANLDEVRWVRVVCLTEWYHFLHIFVVPAIES